MVRQMDFVEAVRLKESGKEVVRAMGKLRLVITGNYMAIEVTDKAKKDEYGFKASRIRRIDFTATDWMIEEEPEIKPLSDYILRSPALEGDGFVDVCRVERITKSIRNIKQKITELDFSTDTEKERTLLLNNIVVIIDKGIGELHR